MGRRLLFLTRYRPLQPNKAAQKGETFLPSSTSIEQSSFNRARPTWRKLRAGTQKFEGRFQFPGGRCGPFPGDEGP
jgi:hypothetical protein